MTLQVHQFPCLSDNYGFLIRDEATGQVATVDTPDAARILSELETLGWGRLDLILNTHWHPDHAGGNADVQAATGCEIVGPEEVRRIAPLDRVVEGGETVRLGEAAFRVLATPGHTLGHIIYHDAANGLAFVGDTIFALGCGRLFEGTPEQMWDSLSEIAALDAKTQLWCAHEYTASNARFTLSLSDDPALRAYADAIFAARERGEATVPTTVAIERRFNPFLLASSAEEFARRRAAKDDFKG